MAIPPLEVIYYVVIDRIVHLGNIDIARYIEPPHIVLVNIGDELISQNMIMTAICWLTKKR